MRKVAMVIVGAAMGFSLPAAADDEPTWRDEYVDPKCEQDSHGNTATPCGGIGYGNGGGYVVKPIRVTALGSQPSGAPINQACLNIDEKLNGGDGFALDEGGKWALPAPCGYHFKMSIQGGKHKDQKLYLTPGCAIALKSTGTTLNNNLKTSADWVSKDAKEKIEANNENLPPEYRIDTSGDPVDPAGNKCGKLNKM